MNLATRPDTVPLLIVDDRPENLLSLEVLLSNQGYELTRATSGNDALRLTLKQDFALVLLDVQMPHMDGFETAELMRTNPKTRHIPIIFVTAGMKDLQFQFKGYDSGAVDYLAKPIEPVFLQSKVRIFAELYRQRREIELHRNHLEGLVEQRTTELRQSAAELATNNEQLQHRNSALKAVEEQLREQVAEFIVTHDQLLATEEMLRVQIAGYETTQKLLNASNLYLQTIFDVSPLAIVVSSFPSGVIRKINRTCSDIFGYSEEFALGKNGVELGLWSGNAAREHFFGQLHEQRGVSGFATDIKTIQGESHSVLLYSTLMDFKDEHCVLTVALDVTEQKLMEEQIRQTQKMDVIGQLAGGVAHDFNNMLTAILGAAELMEPYVCGNPAAAKMLGNIQKAASRSADLTGQLLSFSRKEQKNCVQTCINTTIHEVISLLERTIDKKISLETRLLAKQACVVGDPALLQNALLNLGVNARDAMPDGGVISFTSANIDLDSRYCRSSSFTITPGPYIEITVSDNGTGISEDIVKRVFEPFFTTKEVGKGTGLGLAAVYGTVTDHHGCISLFSEPGTGTVFKIYLPLSHDKEMRESCSQELIYGSDGILLVDDEEVLREVGKSLLESLGYRVYLAEDGQQALDTYAREKDNISLVILDLLMPRMGGKETLRRLMESYPGISVLILSGFSQESTVNDLEKLGAKGFLRKPYLCQELSTAIANAISEPHVKIGADMA
ncbi:MAG: response regulator [Desulfuromonadaceae bacterium]|nr:response regulator [Desulfuromonadaceae bacterium]MDD2847372.1 response regulator [Desulfuromonadaceae bacterium]MDD4131515.1 response regulator [Desulfuromonadaceae bacterium]